MSNIKHTRDKVTLERSGIGANTKWLFTVEGQLASPPQELVINDVTVLSDLKAIIGQVEQAAEILTGASALKELERSKGTEAQRRR